jgi:hypothetical protein
MRRYFDAKSLLYFFLGMFVGALALRLLGFL